MKNGFGRGEMCDIFTLSGIREGENSSSLLAKPSDIWRREILKLTSHYHKYWKCQDNKTISKPDWEQKTGFLKCVPTLDAFTLSRILEGEDF